MAPPLSNEYVLKKLKGLGNYRVEQAQLIALEGEPDLISGALLLTLGLRESGLANILNAEGTDRGCFQISDRYHGAWLDAQPGCPTGSWRAEPGKTALDSGYVPRYTPACVYACDKLKAGVVYADRLGIPDDMHLRFALAAYNAGISGATRGLLAHDVDLFTTGRDYSIWVIAHRTIVNEELHRHLPNWVVKP